MIVETAERWVHQGVEDLRVGDFLDAQCLDLVRAKHSERQVVYEVVRYNALVHHRVRLER